MVDLSNLKLVEENIEVADDTQYVDATEFAPALPEGIYTLIQGRPEFKASKDGFLKAEFAPHTVVGGEQDGQKLMFDSVSAKTFERSGVKVSMIKDHLRALGDRNNYHSNGEFADALAAGEGNPFKVAIKWDGFCGHKDTPQEIPQGDYSTAFTVRGASKFPQDGNGKRLDETTCTVCGKPVRARGKIDRRIAAI